MAWEALVIAGTAGFTIALVPQLRRTLQRGRADDVSALFTGLIIFASASMLVYWIQREEPWYVWVGFGANILVWGVVLWYRLFPRPGALE